MRKTHF